MNLFKRAAEMHYYENRADSKNPKVPGQQTFEHWSGGREKQNKINSTWNFESFENYSKDLIKN